MMPLEHGYTLVRTCIRTGKQLVWRGNPQEAMCFLSTCRPLEVRQVYMPGTGRQVARVERLDAEVIEVQ